MPRPRGFSAGLTTSCRARLTAPGGNTAAAAEDALPDLHRPSHRAQGRSSRPTAALGARRCPPAAGVCLPPTRTGRPTPNPSIAGPTPAVAGTAGASFDDCPGSTAVITKVEVSGGELQASGCPRKSWPVHGVGLYRRPAMRGPAMRGRHSLLPLRNAEFSFAVSPN